MANSKKLSPADRFKLILEETAELSRRRVSGGQLDPGLRLLNEWQVSRLECTYQDYKKQRRYRKAVDFFLNDIYGPKDFSQRDDDIARVFPIMVNVLSRDAISSLLRGLELNSLTLKLDLKLADVLVEELKLDPKKKPAQLDFDMYAEAYRLCDNYDERHHQINSIIDVGDELEALTKKKMILTAVKVARKPAQIAGFGELQSFIERGLSAFRAMGSSHEFIHAIRDREMAILDAIYAEAPVPDWVTID